MSPRRPSAPAEPADDGPWLDPEEPAPRLLLFATPGLAGLEPALAGGAVAAVVVDPRALAQADVDAAIAACRRHATAWLGRGDAAVAKTAGADGVHLDDPDRVAAARTLLGPDRLIGVSCGLSRHAAMVAGEAGADYVMFGALRDTPEREGELADTVAWWSELFVLPCAAGGRLSADGRPCACACGCGSGGGAAGGCRCGWSGRRVAAGPACPCDPPMRAAGSDSQSGRGGRTSNR